MEILIGVAAGALAAAACALSYRMGVKDGMGFKKRGVSMEAGEETQNELMRKYELIMSYDPYGTTEKR